MGKKHYLFAAAAPLAFASLALTPTYAAEIKKRTPKVGTIPKIEGTIPVGIDGNGRIRTVATPPEDEQNSRESRDDEPEEEAKPTSGAKIRSRIPVIKTDVPVEIPGGTRIRSREPVATDDEAVSVDSAEATPSDQRTRGRTPHIDIPSIPVEIENGPRVRSRAPVSTDDAETESATPRTRGRTPHIDASTPAEIEDTPRIRIKLPKQIEVQEEEAPHTRTRATKPDEDMESQSDTPTARSRDAYRDKRGVEPAQETRPATSPDTRITRRKDLTVSPLKSDETPRNFAGKVKPGAVVLKPGTYQQIITDLRAIKTFTLPALEANPTITLGGTSFDFNPMLDNPKSLPNIAKNLKAMPELVEVLPAKMSAVQISQGLVVRSELTYRLKLGACNQVWKQEKLKSAGISCFSYKAIAAQEADFSKPGSAEYVANVDLRAKALAQAKASSKAMTDDIATSVQEFRAQLADPSARAELNASYGEAEVLRLEALDDTKLAGELVNVHDATIEDVAFLPIFQPLSDMGAAFETYKKMRNAAEAKKLAAADAQVAGAKEAKSYPIGEFNYLAGFTLGNKYEWRQRVSTTISWCLVGCKKTYFAEVWAGFGYGFGLRFPMKFSGNYRFDPANGGKAYLDAKLVTFDGNTDDYRSTGLQESKLFGGQEFVAEVGANAGVHAVLPLIGGIGPISFDPAIKLTDYLPGKFAGGNLTPPMPNGEPEEEPFVLDQVDLLGERANLGIVAAKVHPSVLLGLESEGMSLVVSGQGMKTFTLTGGEQKGISLPIDSAQVSNFSVSDPRYNVGFTLTPGLTARVSLNLGVWNTHVDWPVYFPSAKIKIPEGGIDFKCHEGTICTRSFTLSPDGKVSQFKADVKKWALDFDAYWLPKCLDEICKNSAKLKRYDVVEQALAQDGVPSASIYKAPVSNWFDEAGQSAQKYLDQSVVRKADKAAEISAASSIKTNAMYAIQCPDALCKDNVAALAAQMGPRAREIIVAEPYQDMANVDPKVKKEFTPKFTAEIDAAKLRGEIAKNKKLKDQLDKAGVKAPIKPKGGASK